MDALCVGAGPGDVSWEVDGVFGVLFSGCAGVGGGCAAVGEGVLPGGRERDVECGKECVLWVNFFG